ncbi:MAG: AAA family ATPase [Kiritimatiellae bacterium]|nr:AAA family ATPase [Kiritimatiellia bacterium]
MEKVDATFAPGLTVITGETGAGKSVLLGALEFVLGGRADAASVRDGAKEAEVEADFCGTLVRRTVTARGRSRAWIDDESVTLPELRDFGCRMVDFHGPTANQKIMEESFQREALDACSESVITARQTYGKAYTAMRGLETSLAELAADGGEGELDMLRYQVEELDRAGLSEADETIAERHAAAAHAEEIVEGANAITEALGGDDSAAEMLIRLGPVFRAVARHLPAAEEWAAEAENLTVRIQELSRTVADVVSKLDVAGENFEELDRRLTLISGLKRKYLKGAGGVNALREILEAKRTRLDALEHRAERMEELRGLIAAAAAETRAAGAELTARRHAAAERISKAVNRELADLGFPRAKFSIALEPAEPEAHGMDRVVYMFEPNPGEAARPLAAIASSGEIARVMLALKVSVNAATAGGRRAPEKRGTMVFDEIDANIGGEVGRIVGEKLRAVAERGQVIAITHLPQSAVYGERHLVVTKAVYGGRTRAKISEVEGEDRVSEIARMLGGEKSTGVVRRHAEELLEISR